MGTCTIFIKTKKNKNKIYLESKFRAFVIKYLAVIRKRKLKQKFSLFYAKKIPQIPKKNNT